MANSVAYRCLRPRNHTSSPARGQPSRPCWNQQLCHQPCCSHCHLTTLATGRCLPDITAALMLNHHIHTHSLHTTLCPFNGFFCRTIWVSLHWKGKSLWILMKQEMMRWQWQENTSTSFFSFLYKSRNLTIIIISTNLLTMFHLEQ